MSQEEVLLKLVLDSFININEVLSGTSAIEKVLDKLAANKGNEVGTILEVTKKIADNLYERAEKIRNDVSEKYEEWQANSKIIHEKKSENCAEEKDESEKCMNEESDQCVKEKSEKGQNENSSKEKEKSEDNSQEYSKEKTQSEQEKSEEVTVEPDINGVIEESNSENNSFVLLNEPFNNNTTEIKQDETETVKKPLIKLVDINKLMGRGSGMKESSVIVLSSSDEEQKAPTPPRSSQNEQNPELKRINRQKARMNLSSSDEDSNKPLRDIKAKRNTKTRERKQETNFVSSSDEEYITSKKSAEIKDKYKKNDAISKENKKAKRNIEEVQKKLPGDISIKVNSKRKRRSSNSSDDKKAPKKSTLKINPLSLANQFHKNIRESQSNVSEQSSEDEVDSTNFTTKTKGRLEKKSIFNESSLSETSSDETDIERSRTKHKKKKHHKIQKVVDGQGDDKFKLKVFIPLPRIPCEKLKELYMRKRETLEIKRLTNMDNLITTTTGANSKEDDNNDLSSSLNVNSGSKQKEFVSTPTITAPSPAVSVASEGCDNVSIAEEDPLMLPSTTEDTEQNDENQRISDIIDEIKDVSDKEDNASKDVISSESETEKKSKEKEDKKDDEKIESVKDKSNSESDKSGEKNTDDEETKKKKKWRSDKLLTEKLSSTDSDEELEKFRKDKEEARSEIARKIKGKMKKKVNLISDSDDSDNNDKNEKSGSDNSKDGKSSSSSEESDKEEGKEDSSENKKSSARRRIKRTKESSSDEEKTTRKQIRKVIDRESLSETTKKAEAEEKERKARLAEKQKKYNQLFDFNETDSTLEKLVLDFDEKTKTELLSVHKTLVKKLKPHQASGIQFMWDACFESVERAKDEKGSGCILAHCMGLGKTLQVIALTHTLLTNQDKTGVERVLVVCPLNTVLNWKQEYKKWMPRDTVFDIYELVSCKQNNERSYRVKDWYEEGGVLIIGYNMFRSLSNPDNKRLTKKMRAGFQEGLVNPGPDLVICDEGHLLKNEKTHLSIAMNRIRTPRRIVLTGTPLQNNLKEYWCMVQFIKPNLLGTYKEYLNRFVNPITNGQYTDSTDHDIQVMRRRSHVLHKLLDGVVQRRDYAVLQPYLPPKYEYVLFINLTDTQVKLYQHYMDNFARRDSGNKTSFLFTDFQQLQRICTHPRVLRDKSKEEKLKLTYDSEDSEGSLKDFVVNDTESSGSEDSDASDSGGEKQPKRKRLTRAALAQRKENNESGSDVELISEPQIKEWWQGFCDGDELENINNSGKLYLLFEILRECEQIGDKVLVFSQSLYTLNCIEYFLSRVDEATQIGNTDVVGGHKGSWALGLDYFRLDGSSSCDNRHTWCHMFNNPNNTRARLFLISTKAGGLGINLVAANRVIIFDVSWNPSHDIQSIYRVYRFGQTKPSYIYRFVTYGTMEMKIYERQVTKQAISKRVIDEQQIDRHYNQNDLQELYKCDLMPIERPIPLVPKDVLLGELLQKYENHIYKYHEHQSLLENKEEEGLNEEERKAAWEEFETEKVQRNMFSNTAMGGMPGMNFSSFTLGAALTNMVRRDNPTWSEIQIKGIIPAMMQQLQLQISEGDMTLFVRAQKEMQLMQAAHAQKLKEQYYQQNYLKLIKKQQQANQMLGNLSVNPEDVLYNQYNVFSNQNQSGPSNIQRFPNNPNEVIELND